MSDDILEKVRDSLADLDLENTLRYVEEALNQGVDVVDIIMKGLTEGMKIVGERFEREEYFIAEVVVAAEIFKEVMNMLKPRLSQSNKGLKPIGRVIIGTVYGDIHDIGKNLVAAVLEANNFEVIDLGVDVPPEKFVKAVEEYQPDILGISALLTTTMMNIKNVVEALEREGLRNKVKIIVGGAPVTEEFARSIGADAYAEDAFKTVEVCKRLIEEKRRGSQRKT
ncbi:MAG: cobalamin-binding protein [Thermoprotei archaeon]|nr:MAG: cobalamin-binding protein [Thermoprotei archaeon]